MELKLEEVKKNCLKSDEVPFFEKSFRKFSVYLTWIFLNVNISANQATSIMIFVGLVAGLCLATPIRWVRFSGALLLIFYYLLDLVDGDIARYRKTYSITGIYYDYFSHYIVNPFIFICIAFGMYLEWNSLWCFFWGFLSAFSLILVDLNMYCCNRAVLDVYTSNKNHPNLEKIKKITISENKHADVSSMKTFLNRFLSFFVHFFVVIQIILLATILDLFQISTVFHPYKINFLYIVITFYGILLTLLWIKILFSNIKNGIEREYYKIFN